MKKIITALLITIITSAAWGYEETIYIEPSEYELTKLEAVWEIRQRFTFRIIHVRKGRNKFDFKGIEQNELFYITVIRGIENGKR